MQVPHLSDLVPLGTLTSPVRRRLYELVARAGGPVGREEAAAATGVRRSLAAYHLDRLAASGLLEVEYRRRGDRSGPGAGRPAKLYRLATREFVLRVPPRDYPFLAMLLADVAAATGDEQAIETTARAAGRRLGTEFRAAEAEGDADLTALLRARGYDPLESEPGTLRLRNCPFGDVAERHPELVCRLNLALLEGMIEGAGAEDARAFLAPEAGRCCVAIARKPG